MAAAAAAFLKTLAAEPPIKPGTPDPYTPPKPGDMRAEEHLQIGQIIPIRHHDGASRRCEPCRARARPAPRGRIGVRLRVPEGKRDGLRHNSHDPCGRWRGDQIPRQGDDMTEGKQLGVLLARFADTKAAAKARGPLDSNLRSAGDAMLNTTVLKVDAKHKASVHDPRRVLMGI